MNKGRAIQMLERMQDPGPYEPQITSEAFDALQMAIEALKYSEVPNSSDTDTISRQDAKDMIKNHKSDFSTEKDYRTARACVNAVPPAQPELIEKAAYIRGFEQGRTQGRIDSHGGKK